jgi:hypothetical protein
MQQGIASSLLAPRTPPVAVGSTLPRARLLPLGTQGRRELTEISPAKKAAIYDKIRTAARA